MTTTQGALGFACDTLTVHSYWMGQNIKLLDRFGGNILLNVGKKKNEKKAELVIKTSQFFSETWFKKKQQRKVSSRKWNAAF